MKRFIKQKLSKITVPVLVAIVAFFSLGVAMPVYAGKTCGVPPNDVQTSIDLGCSGHGNPIMDLLFAIIRLLTYGVGIVVVASVVIAGIQFSTARSDPQAAASAITRLRTSLIALLIYIFAYAILNFIIPGGFFT